MGAGASTPHDSKQVFQSEHPIQFSQEVLESLQASSETNSTRAKSLELHIQTRVASELEKLQKQKADALKAKEDEIRTGKDSSKDEKKSWLRPAGLLEIDLSGPKKALNLESEEDKKKNSASSQKVSEEIKKLEKALGDRKKLVDMPKEVETARSEVITCLRLNDRQALNCWQEVENFKREVRKMEDQFVGKVL